MVRVKKEKDGTRSIILEDEEMDRPVSSRGKWDTDPGVDQSIRNILATADTGKARRLKISEAELLHRLNMFYRNALKKEGLVFAYRKLDDHTISAWVRRAKEAGK